VREIFLKKTENTDGMRENVGMVEYTEEKKLRL
jgi:hypothetical protein